MKQVTSASTPTTAWFTGPKSENGVLLANTLRHIVHDYLFWRRNYFPEDGVVVRAKKRRRHEVWNDEFNDRLLELLGTLKSDFPFFSPRYVAHMLAEQTIPSIAGYLAGMLYNPNNVSREAAPVTVHLELEAAGMIAEMLGYDRQSCWGHLTSGGTIANAEALWIARSVRYLPLLLADLSERLDLEHPLRSLDQAELMRLSPDESIPMIDQVFELAIGKGSNDPSTVDLVLSAWANSPWNVVEQGIASVCARLSGDPVILVPETHHYCFPKIADLLGLGRRSLVSVPVDSQLRMDTNALLEILGRIEKEGHHLLALVSVIGTTEEGAIDPLDEILALRDEVRAAGRAGFWIHADAAWGGYLRTLTIPDRLDLGKATSTLEVNEREVEIALELPGDEVFAALEALGRCDSITVDPHKLGYIPYPAGAVCLKSRGVLPLVRQEAPYIDEQLERGKVQRQAESIGVYVLEGSKPGAAAASVWLSHSTIPLDNTGHGRLLRDTVRNACLLHSLLEYWPQLEPDEQAHVRAITLCPPDSNIVCCSFRAPGMTLVEINRLNKELYENFSLTPEQRSHMHEQKFFVSRTHMSPPRYRLESMRPFLDRLGASDESYRQHGVKLLRMTLMSPWITPSRVEGRDLLVELTAELYDKARALCAEGLPGREPRGLAR